MTKTVIDVDGLVKSFGRVQALDGLDLVVTQGEIHGFLGPNGAGKSTTIRALLGLLRIDGGSATVFGLYPWRDHVSIHQRLAYVPGDVSLWPNLTGGEVIDLLIGMRRVDASDRDQLIERFDLDPSKKCRTYSKGNRQKVALVAALAGNPELLILDEPTSGLDPLMEDVFRECVRERVGEGASVLLSSHILSEVEQLCDRVTIIRSGRTVETGSLADLRHLTRTKIHAVTQRPLEASALPTSADVATEGLVVSGTVPSEALSEVLAALSAAGIVSLESGQPSLEELFRDVYAAQVSDSAAPEESGRHRA